MPDGLLPGPPLARPGGRRARRVLPDRLGGRLPLGGRVPLHHGGASSSPARPRSGCARAIPVIAGEEISPLGRVLVVADSGNGVSATLDWRRFLFINVDLSVHLHRLPAGEWVCLDAVTLPQPDGIGLADTLLLDERGPIGRAAQTLLVAARG